MKDDAPREDTRNLPVRRALELVRVLRRDALRRQQLAQRRVDLDLAAHERVEAARGPGVLRELLLDDLLDDLAAVGYRINHLGLGRGHDDHAVLVADDRIARSDSNPATADDAVALPGLHGRGPLSRRRRVGEAGEAVGDDLVRVSD